MFINDFQFMESMPSTNNNFVLKTEPYGGEATTYNGNVWITGNYIYIINIIITTTTTCLII